MAFLAVAALAYVVPGPDFLVVLRASATGRRSGLVAAAGTQAGLCVHVLAAACGLSLLLAHAPGALTAVRFAGAGYLCYLGVRAIRAARTAGGGTQPAPPRFLQGFTTNVLNPKAVLFFAAVLPQFLDPAAPPTGQILLLGAADVVLGIVVWALLVVLGAPLARALGRPRVARAWERATGTAFVGFGAALATTRLA